ncbi:hypothetical protein EJ05DRAFT_515576 [Pseudovirgaria hyperparasitica]|uniref:Uncharacterized protein n=1 Tax=Pseudovirgaria hyperparasitica TaxID=470096 RepID=A0A6A6VPJ5_9PEZI|nr:uncharacterized protein EJ05DRAFT_515576 [Pseudovirgaria hyperparasitica]KAF2752542.1 hypothetical protein EJ05DRAFT_515576 [Pseudovirgaria hyperparasitica]
MPVGLGAAAYACLYSRTSKREDLKIRYDMLLARSQLPHSLRRPMPPCEGPKLSAFKRGGLAIHFIKLLSSSPRLDGSEGAEGSHSYVFKVRIGKKKYALKVFKFFSVEHERSSVSPTDKVKASDEIIAYHSDPFFAECRAYGILLLNPISTAP